MSRQNGLSFLCAFCLLTLGLGPAEAARLTLSTYSSEEGSNPYTLPQWLDATLDFSVNESTLVLTATNTTGANPPDYQFKINRLYFNIGGAVSAVGLDGSYPDWHLVINPDNIHVAGFGLFDVGLIGGVGRKADLIDPGETDVFTFDISGIGPYTDADFTSHLSKPLGLMQALAAAKFVSGGPAGDDSAFGAVIPEPATFLLLAVAALSPRRLTTLLSTCLVKSKS
jgi:hypothetical protein